MWSHSRSLPFSLQNTQNLAITKNDNCFSFPLCSFLASEMLKKNLISSKKNEDFCTDQKMNPIPLQGAIIHRLKIYVIAKRKSSLK